MTAHQEKPTRILVVDDDRIIRIILEKAISKEGYQVITAENGSEGLQQARIHHPDLVITDKMMPVMDGFEFIRRLRNDPEFLHLPILILTSQSELEDKLGAFEAGADDYLPKPFESAELLVRLAALLRRADALNLAKAGKLEDVRRAQLIAVHSLRGGSGCSSIAANLAVSLSGLWKKPTLLADMVLTAGQAAVLLNQAPKRTWADLAKYETHEIDSQVLQNIVGQHDCGLSFILGPSNPANAEAINGELLSVAMSMLRSKYDYIVADLPHNFSEIVLNVLDNADIVVLVAAPELASVRAAAITLDTYRKLGYKMEKVRLVLNWTFEEGGLSSKKISEALKQPMSLVLPFAPKQFVTAINRGTPLILSNPGDPVSALLEDFAFRLSKETHQKEIPAQPSEAWLRMKDRLQAASKPKDRMRSLWPL